MSLIVQKFGGSSVADADKIRNVARIITDTYKQGHDVVAVLSAQGDTTDDLIEKASEINPDASKREMDMLLSTGEQISCSLCAMAIEAMGCPVVSLTGWQAGFRTNSGYGNARIKRVKTDRLEKELDQRRIVIVTGFQGINKYYDITTLGRGGSDTSAVALAAALHADLCQIYTDVDGVYTADPRLVSGARKLDEITYDEMLELATLGAQVLHNRSVEMAKRYSVNLEVLSSFSGKPGTKVKEVVKTMERSHISRSETKDISFTVAKGDMELAQKLLEENRDIIRFDHIDVTDNIAKVSIVGAGMVNNPGVAAAMFEALFSAGINISMISTSEIKVSVLVDIEDADRAVQVIHERFYDEFGDVHYA